MRLSARIGAAASAVGLLVGGAVVLAASAQADVAVPVVNSYSPTSSSTIGGGALVITGENLYGVERVSFGDVDTTNFYYDGTTVSVWIPPHAPGVVDVVLHLDGDTEELPVSTSEVTVTGTGTTTFESVVTSAVFTTIDNTPISYATTYLTTVESEIPVTQTLSTTVSDSFPAESVVDGEVAVAVGEFVYGDVWTVIPDEGPIAGGTNVEIDGNVLDQLIYAGLCLGGDFGGLQNSESLSAAAVEFDLLDLDVYFGDELGTDSRLVVDIDYENEVLELSIKTTTPEYVAGPVDVTVVFPDADCGDFEPTAVVAAALPPFGDDDLVFTIEDGYTYLAAALPPTTTETVIESVTEEATVSATVTVTELETGTESDADTTSGTVSSTSDAAPSSTTTSGPVLSATGVSSSTGPMIAVGLGLLLLGGFTLTIGRRTARQH